MYTTLIYFLIGLILIIVSISIYIRIKKIRKSGIETEGIIFSSEMASDPNLRFGFPVVRFLTKENEWITETYNISLSFYKKGQKITIIYLPDKPTEFIIKTKFNYLIIYLLGIAGVFVLLFGVLQLLKI
jgi:hypothetical protein